MFIEKLILILKYFDRFGMAGVKLLFTTLYGKQKILELKFPTFRHPIYIRNKTSDVPTFYQCIFDEGYNINLGFEPETIVDLGSNIGMSAVFFATRYPEAKIVCVEPEKENFELLVKNTKPFKNVFNIMSGVWHRKANLEVKDNGGGSWGFTVEETDKETGLKAITIDDIMQQSGIDKIDLLKIDVEGTERELFSQNFENWLNKVRVIIIELHDKTVPGCTKSFFTALQNHEYAVFFKGDNTICYLGRLDRPGKKKVKVF